MKSFSHITAFILLLLVIHIHAFTQPAPPPLNADESNNTFVGEQSGAPVGNGTFFLISFAMLYGVRRIYQLKKAGSS